MIKILSYSWAFLLLLQQVLFAQNEDVLNIRVTHINYPPQYYQEINGNWTGLDVELAKALVTEAGFKFAILPLPWSRALAFLKSGNLHMMMNLSKTDERSQFLYWVGPERYSKMVLVVNKEFAEMNINSLDDFPRLAIKHKTKFGIQNDIFYGKDFMEKLKESTFRAEFESVSAAKTNFRKLAYKRILGFFEDKITMTYKIRTDPEFNGFTLHPFVVNKEPVYFGVSKAGVSKSNLKKLQDALERLNKNGTMDAIREKDW